MFLIRYHWLSAPEAPYHIIAGHPCKVIHHIIQSHYSGFHGRAQSAEISPLFTEPLFFEQLIEELFKLIAAASLSCK